MIEPDLPAILSYTLEKLSKKEAELKQLISENELLKKQLLECKKHYDMYVDDGK